MPVADPDATFNTIDVFSSGTGMNSIIPATPGGLVTVTTAGGTSNAVQVGPATFTGISTVAASGTPADGGEASANPLQSITLLGSGFGSNTVIVFPTVDDSGNPSTASVNPSSISPDGTQARVTVPQGAATGAVTVHGAPGTQTLQVVPRIDALSFTTFASGQTLTVTGVGFIEGGITVHFGAVNVVDPDAGTGTINVDSTNARILNMVIPVGAGTAVSVTTTGGTSSVFDASLPSAAITSPASGSAHPADGPLTVSAQARDATGISDITFLVDGTPVAPTLADVFALSVDGRANIFLAGGNAGAGGGVVAPGVTFSGAAGDRIVFLDVTGVVSGWAAGCLYNGPDGNTVCGNNGTTNVASSGGIAGLTHNGATMFLAGIFVDGNTPAAPAPVRLDATGSNDQAVISPGLNQAFFIGDGLTADGQMQEFVIPAGATRLFLGFVETSGFNGGGAPSGYADNGGSLLAGFAVVSAAPSSYIASATSTATPATTVNAHLFMSSTGTPDTLSVAARATDTNANSVDSAAISLSTVDPVLTVDAVASFGTPADAGLPSSNAAQVISLSASYRAFHGNTLLAFPVTDDNGLPGIVKTRVLYVSDDGTEAWVTVPQNASTGEVEVDGVGSFTLQIVPRLTGFSNNNDFVTGSFIRFTGSGFIEGAVSVSFGSSTVIDPDTGTGTINVQSTSTLLDTNIPASPGGAVTVTTVGGTSNVLQVGPASFTGIVANAAAGTPADPGTSSANPEQVVTITGTGLRTTAYVTFPQVDASGVVSTVSVRVTAVNAAGTEAQVQVPLQAVSGFISLIGAPESHELQSVPRLFGFSNSDFVEGVNLQLSGRGFIEGATTINFGAASVSDPDVSSTTVDVFSSNTGMNVTIPSNAGGLVSVMTDGGTSNAIQVGPSAFTSINATLALGTPANPALPAATPGQLITVTGTGLRANTNVRFPIVDASGLAGMTNARVSGAKSDGTEATIAMPLDAVTGAVSLIGAPETNELQSVPRLFGFSNSDFTEGVNVQLSGRGFVEGAVTVRFGDIDLVDPDISSSTVDVFSSNTTMNVTIPSDAGGQVTVTTAGGTSNPLQVGPESFGNIVATLALGTPANPALPAATPGQLITITGAGLRSNTIVRFPSVDPSGLPGTVTVRVGGAKSDGTEATLNMPLDAVTGAVSLSGAPETNDLQSVPRLFSFSNSDFLPGVNLQLSGRGFVEGALTVHFGDADLVDPDASFPTIDVFSSNTTMNVAIPADAGGLVSVTTAGGTSNAIQVGPSSFTAITSVLAIGTPADPEMPAATPGQLITVTGSGLQTNTNLLFPTIDDSGVPGTVSARVSGVNAEGTEATVIVPLQAVNGDVTVFGAPGSHFMQSVPRILSFSLPNFAEGQNLQLSGRGFIEGAITITFGGVEVEDPNTSFTTVDVFSSNTVMNVTIPAGAEPSVFVTTAGGTSNTVALIADTLDQAPVVTVNSPLLGDSVFEGGAVPITVSASDDVFLKSVTVQVLDPFFDVTASYSKSLPPFNFIHIVPPGGPAQLVLRATGEDLGGNVGVSADVIVNVSASPISIASLATSGTPADGSLPSANVGQTITLNAPPGTFTAASTVRFPTLNDAGVAGTIDVIVASASPGGDSATVAVPGQATTGGVTVPGALGNAALQVVPVVSSFTNSSFRPGVNLSLTGSGFAEGATTVNFGATPVVDPNAGSSVLDVFSSNTFMNVTIPAGPGAIVTVSTLGGTSAPVTVGPTTFTAITAEADFGTPANAGVPSANAGQAITVFGSDLKANSAVLFPAVDDSGAVTAIAVTVTSAAPDGTSALVVVPNNAVTGAVTMPGAVGSVQLQVVPRITGFNNADFRPSGTSRNMQLFGSGFVEGGITVSYGATDVVDPDIGFNTVDVFSSATSMNSVVPNNAGAVLTVITAGGTSNQVVVGPTSFTGITGVASFGTPADDGSPSANVGQAITVTGANFAANTNLVFPTVDDSGLPGTVAVRVSSVNIDGTEAIVVVPTAARTGTVTMPGNSGSASLQVVPRITGFSNADFRPSGTGRNLTLSGSGFVEGGITVNFGAAPVVDPDVGFNTIDVYSSGTGMNSVIPNNPGGLVTVTTDGGTSNGIQAGPASFTGITATASFGTPANGGLPSANAGQLIEITGSGFGSNTNVVFTTRDDSGINGTTPVRVTGVNATGTEATVAVPAGVVTGPVSVSGATGSFTLQVVPRLTGFSNADFAPSGASRNLTLSGSGFVEGGITVNYGATPVVDPDTSFNTIDVYSSGTAMNSVIPANPGGAVTVTTAGGTSNSLQAGPSSFTAITAAASFGTPANGGLPSANVGQVITLTGTGFGGNSNVRFTSRDDSGITGAINARVSFISQGGTSAQVVVPAGAVTGPVTVYGATGSFTLQVVPRITSFSNADFAPSGANRNLTLSGSGFVEGGITVNFGSAPVADPDGSANTIDVYSSGTAMNSVIPANPGGLVTVTTAGGTSNSIQAGPASFTGITAAASSGTPVNGAAASANPSQVITVTGSGLGSNTVLAFPMVDISGTAGVVSVNPSSVNPDGTEARVTVPQTAVTGTVAVHGAPQTLSLQVVPRIDSLSFTSFTPGQTLTITGAGFVEGAVTVRFGAVSVVDPNVLSTTLDVYNNNSSINVTIPAGAGTAISVVTAGGTSNTFDTVLPSAVVTSPAGGSTEPEETALTVSAQARDTAGISGVTFLVDGTPIVPTLTDVFALSVDGRANVFGAGLAAAPGGGLLPPGMNFSGAAGDRIVFLDVTGAVSGWAAGCAYNGPDGGRVCGNNGTTNVASAGGIAGLTHDSATMFLAGVFVDDSAPAAPAPAQLDVSDFNNQAVVSPGLNQVFFIGDGLTVDGQMQEFVIPAGATRLFLGFVENSGFNTGAGPSAYSDNGGSLLAGFAVVDAAPSSFVASATSTATPATTVNAHLFMSLPSAPDALSIAARATDTDANTVDSAAVSVAVIAPVFTQDAAAAFGTPADAGEPSANASQTIELNANYRAFTANTLVTFLTVNDNGVAGTTQVRVAYATAGGTQAWVTVPQNASTGTVVVDGIGSFTLQVVPRLTGFSNNNDFTTGSFIRFSGSGFIEGGVSVNFGPATVADPDGGTGTINVHSTSTLFDMNIPASPGGAVTVTTAGGTSNVLQAGPASFTGITATATAGTPADPGTPSANPEQVITITGTGLRTNTYVTFPQVDANGVASNVSVRVIAVNATGTEAQVEVPLQAVSGLVSLIGAPQSHELQSVPRLFGFSNSDFAEGVNLQLSGRGFIEGTTTVNFGPTSVSDPDTSWPTVDVFSSNTTMNVTIPASAGGLVTVTTSGGVSNAIQVGPSAFTSVVTTAAAGTPAAPGTPSANPEQLITITGAGFRTNTNVLFPTVDANGAPGVTSVRVQGVNVDGTEATLIVPLEAVTGQITVFGVAFTLEPPADVSGLTQVYSNDFEAPVTGEWSNTTRTSTTGTDVLPTAYLGRFGNQAVVLTLTGLPAHTSLVLEWDQFILDSWDGVERVGVFQDGVGLIEYQRIFPMNSNAISIEVDPDVTGEFGPVGTWPDRLYRDLRAALPHSGGTVSIVFFGAGLQDISDESWGLDNLRVLVSNGPLPPLSRLDLQIVPRLFGFSNSDFLAGQNLQLTGRGFVEGATTIHFGETDVVDPDVSWPTVDVFSSNTFMNVTMPTNPGGLVSVTTAGGTSNALQIGAATFTGTTSAAASGTPTDAGLASANPGQLITITGSGFRSNTNMLFPSVDVSGNPGTVASRLVAISADGTEATVVVPDSAVTGVVTVSGAAGSFTLQIVPRIDSFTVFGTFTQGVTIRLNGAGFVEGATTIHFGPTDVVDPDASFTTVDVWNANHTVDVTVPAAAGNEISVTTAGGTSNTVVVP